MGYCKCPGEDCPIKEKCFRYTWPGNEYWQSWFHKTPKRLIEGTCAYFLPNGGK